MNLNEILIKEEYFIALCYEKRISDALDDETHSFFRNFLFFKVLTKTLTFKNL